MKTYLAIVMLLLGSLSHAAAETEADTASPASAIPHETQTSLSATETKTKTYTPSYSDVWLCIDPDGRKHYKNNRDMTGDSKCKKVNLPGITAIPPAHPQPKPTIGMSKAEVRKKLGKPTSIRQVQTRYGVSERWSYPGQRVLTFQNGSLEVIEN